MKMNVELFYKLCENYNVELSNKYSKPRIVKGTRVCAIRKSDIRKIFGGQQI